VLARFGVRGGTYQREQQQAKLEQQRQLNEAKLEAARAMARAKPKPKGSS